MSSCFLCICIQSINHSINQSFDQLFNQSIIRSIIQPINHSINYSINQSFDQLFNQSIIRSFDQLFNQSINQSINHSFNQSICVGVHVLRRIHAPPFYIASSLSSRPTPSDLVPCPFPFCFFLSAVGEGRGTFQ